MLDDIHLSPYIQQTTQPDATSLKGVQYKPISQIISELSDGGIVIPEDYSIVGFSAYIKRYPHTPIGSYQPYHAIMNVMYLDNNETEYIDANTFSQLNLPSFHIKPPESETYIADNYPSNYEPGNSKKYLFDGREMFSKDLAHSCFAVISNRPYIINGFTPDESNHEYEAGFRGVTRECNISGGIALIPYFNLEFAIALIYGKWVKTN